MGPLSPAAGTGVGSDRLWLLALPIAAVTALTTAPSRCYYSAIPRATPADAAVPFR